MAVQNSVAARNASLDGRYGVLGASPKLQIRTGAQPASCAAAATGALIAELTLSATPFAAAANGAKALNAVAAVLAVAGGTMGHYRLVDSAGTTCHEQGSIGLAAASPDLAVDNPGVLVGQSINVTGWTITEAGA